jgi:hypothetical protein
LRTLFIVALAATLAGCSRQPPPHAQAATECHTGTNRFACVERAAGPPVKLATFRIKSSTTGTRSAAAEKTEKSPSVQTRHAVHLAGKSAKSTAIAAKAEPPASRVPLPPSSPKTHMQAAGNAGESKTTGARIAEPDRTVGLGYSNTRTIEAQVAAATALAERVTAATAPPSPDTKTDNREASGGLETLVPGNADNPGSALANDKDLLVVVLMARSGDMKSVSDLTGMTIAIDDRYSASNRTVRTALIAAGASFVQLSESQATAINRLVNGEVPAAVLALVSAEAAEGFPEIPGFRIFHIPISPRSVKARP